MDFMVCRDNADPLQHHGIIGQRWGIRRFQNEDRTWTEAGKERYNDGPGEGSSSGGSSGSTSGSSGSTKSSVKNATEKVKSSVSSAKDKAVSTDKDEKGKAVDAAKDVKDKAENAIDEDGKEPTQEELDARAARRKDIAKKVAIGVGITAAVVGTAFVAKYAHDKIKDLKSINDGEFADKLSSTLDLEFKELDPHKTLTEVNEGKIKLNNSFKTGMAGVVERTSGEGMTRQAFKIKDARDSGKLSNYEESFYNKLNRSVDNYLKATLDDKMDQSKLNELREKANRVADATLEDVRGYYSRNREQEKEYLTDVARDFLAAREKDPTKKKYRDVSTLSIVDEFANSYSNSSPEALRQLANTIRITTGREVSPDDFRGLAEAVADVVDPTRRSH